MTTTSIDFKPMFTVHPDPLTGITWHEPRAKLAAPTFTPGPRHMFTVGKPRADGLAFVIETQADLEQALSAIFEAAKPEHGLLNVGWLEYDYDGAFEGFHDAKFADEDTVYDVLFDRSLELLGIFKEGDVVWCAEKIKGTLATGGYISSCFIE